MKQYPLLNELIAFIARNDGIAEKAALIEKVQQNFNLRKARSLFCSDEFTIRFSQSQTENLSNTILSLSTLKNYDDKPVVLCVTTPDKNYLLLMNATFLSKISHSSKTLRIDNIKGSFNGSDIMRTIDGISNKPENFDRLWDIHTEFTFEENLERLVEATNNISPIGQRFELNSDNEQYIKTAVDRTISFIRSDYYKKLNQELSDKVKSVENEIKIAAFIDNVNIRGRVIEYLITENNGKQKEQLISALKTGKRLPKITVKDGLGDYSKNYGPYHIETDIKTKLLFLSSNPKAYNFDKLLSFLATDKSVYMIYLLGITKDKQIMAKLLPVFDKTLVDDTLFREHWAGRNSRGVAQFTEKGLLKVLAPDYETTVDREKAEAFLEKLIGL